MGRAMLKITRKKNMRTKRMQREKRKKQKIMMSKKRKKATSKSSMSEAAWSKVTSPKG